MKNILFVIAFLVCIPVFGQRFAYVDTEYILNQLPSYKAAQTELNFHSEQWEKEIEKKKEEIQKLEQNLVSERVLLTDDVIKQREEEINKRRKELKDYQAEKFGVNGELFKKRQELVKPIQDQVFEAIQKVAKDNALDFIFDKAGCITMLVSNPKYDRSDEVLEELGVDPTSENPGQAPEEEQGEQK